MIGLAACSDLSGGNNGVVALEVRLPSPAAVEPDDTLLLKARALDAEGDSVPVPVLWRTLDDSLLTIVDSTGAVTTDKTSGQPRVQAYVGSLGSQILTLTIRPRSDNLVLTVPATITVPAADTASAPLGAAVQSLNPAGGVPGTSILYEVTDPAALGTVRFANGLLQFRGATGTDGAPVVPVLLRKVAGATPPGTVLVQVSASRPSGTPVPGSGQQFTILFQ
jgi:hypothetical protein